MLCSSVLVSGEEHRRLWHFGSLLLSWGWDWAAQHFLPQPWPTDSTSDSVTHWPQWDPLHQHSGQSLQGLHSFTQHRVQVRDWISNLAQAWWGIWIQNRITGNRQLCSRLFRWMPSVIVAYSFLLIQLHHRNLRHSNGLLLIIRMRIIFMTVSTRQWKSNPCELWRLWSTFIVREWNIVEQLSYLWQHSTAGPKHIWWVPVLSLPQWHWSI